MCYYRDLQYPSINHVVCIQIILIVQDYDLLAQKKNIYGSSQHKYMSGMVSVVP